MLLLPSVEVVVRHRRRRWLVVAFVAVVVQGWSASTSTPPQPPASSSPSPSTTTPLLVQPIRHVAVIGAGIAGLSVAHALLQTNHNNNRDVTVDLYDARPSLEYAPSTGGGGGGGAGVQLNGGLVALGRIHPRLREAVYRAGLPQTGVESRSSSSSSPQQQEQQVEADNNSNSQGEQLLLRLDLRRIISSSSRSKSLLEEDDNNNNNNNNNKQPRRRLWWISIMRGALQQTLLDQLLLLELPPKEQQPSSSSSDRRRLRVQLGKKLVRIRGPTDENNLNNGNSSGGGYTCQFADGTQSDQAYDLIVDASGINSVTRRYIQNPQRLAPAAAHDADDDNRKTAIYSGIRIRYAVADWKQDDASFVSSSPSSSSSSGVTLRQHFGRAAYALSGVYGAGAGQPPARCAFIVYLDPNSWGPFGRRQPQPQQSQQQQQRAPRAAVAEDENADWSQDNRAPSLEMARRDMLEQLQASGIPVTTEVGQYIAQADRFFELGSYFHNPFHRWSRGRLVLCGDAAHALPPFLGQGANQAIQDAYCLVQQLWAYNAAVQDYNSYLCSAAAATTTRSIDENTNSDDQPPPEPPQLQNYLDAYEKTRWPATFAVFWKSVFLGYLETGGFDGVYAKFRDVFFQTMGRIGVAERVLIDAATPKLE